VYQILYKTRRYPLRDIPPTDTEPITQCEASMRVTGIKQDIIDLLLKMGEESHPREFAALLVEENGIICEVNLIPGTISGNTNATLLMDMIPLGSQYAGSAHSHPNGIIRPSHADISFFGRTGRCHLIIGYPYTKECFRCFTSNGTEQQIEVVS